MSTAHSSPPAVPPTATASWLWWSGLVAATGLVLALFGPSLLYLRMLWDRDANYSHGYLVAPISLFFAYRTYRRVGPPLRGELLLGLSGVVVGVLLQLAAGIVRWPPLSYLGLLAVLRGLLVSAGGRQWASAFNFSLLFLFFMFPLPVTWTSYAALWLQDIVSRISETVLSLFLVCHRVGHSIRIAGMDQSLVVAAECSGLGQIVAFLAFAALLGELFSRPLWYRSVLLVGAIPVAIAANTLRVVLMNLGAYWFGTQWLSGTLHDAPALFSLPVGILLFLLLDRVLAGFVEQPVPPSSGAPTDPASLPAPPPAPPPNAPTDSALGRRLLVAAVVLGLGVGGQLALASHLRQAGELSYPAMRGTFASLPLEIPDPETGQLAWRGQDLPEARDQTKAKLGFATEDLLIRGYINSQGEFARLYMVYSLAGEDRKHHPEICVRDVSGAPEDIRFRREVPLSADGSAAASRFRFQTGAGQSTVIYYWHYTPRPFSDPNQSAIQALHQRIGVSAPSVTVQVSVAGDNPRTLEAVEKQLLPAIHRAALQQVLPPDTETGCNRIPIGLARQ
jgi:exosortase